MSTPITPTPASAPASHEGKGLAAGTLGLWGSTVIGLASTAPVYSLAATLGFVVLTVGEQAPIAFVIAFVPMLLIAFAYRELNRDVPDCGTTFTWATKAFGPWVGWLGGWGVAVAGTIVLANLAQIGGIYFWLLVAPDLAENAFVVTLTGVVFIALMSWVSWRGLEIGERMQNVLLAVQYLALILFVVFATWHVIAGTAPEGSTTPEASWFDPFAFSSFDAFVESVLLALFIYWGWDTCLVFSSWRNFWNRLVFPLVGAVLLTGAFVYSAIDMLDPDYGYTVLLGVGGVFVVGVGSLVLGAVLMVVWSFFAEAKPFFRGESLNRDTEVLVPDEDLPVHRSIDGGV